MTTTDAPITETTIAGIRARVAEARADGKRVALVPTMGALHKGHLSLVKKARKRAEVVVVSIFVNPLQFGEGEDLDRYPRTPDEDLAALAELGVEYVFAPTVDEVYPHGKGTIRVTAGAMATRFEGRSRPGHFDGVLTVVAKLIGIVGPDLIVFGQKDAQQLFIVRAMVRELNMPVEVFGAETVRESDGLALSSRNRFLSDRERRAARVLSMGLEAAVSMADRGIDAVTAAAQAAIMGEPLVKLDYLQIVDAETFVPIGDDFTGSAIVLVAATVGTTRLIDNTPITFV